MSSAAPLVFNGRPLPSYLTLWVRDMYAPAPPATICTLGNGVSGGMLLPALTATPSALMPVRPCTTIRW